MFILFTPLNGRKFDGKAVPKFVNKVNKVNNTLKGLKGKAVSPSNLVSLLNCLNTLKVGNTSMKVGVNFISSLIEDQSILNPNSHQDLMTTSYGDSSASKENYLYTTVKIGTGYSPQVGKYKNGPTYSEGHRKLLDTVNDCRSSSERAQLKMSHGANQRYYSFLESTTCLTIDDIELLSQYEDEKSNIQPYFNNVKKEILRRNTSKKRWRENIEKDKLTSVTNKTKLKRKLLENTFRRNDRKFVRHWAALLKNRTEITISNRLEALTSRVTIHMLQYTKTSVAKNNCNISDLLKNCKYKVSKEENLVNESDIYLEKLNADDIVETSTSHYINRIVTPLDVNLTKIESFKEHCRVVDSWSQILKPNAVWKFKLTKSYKHGIYLNKLHQLKSESIDVETPVNYFFLIESFGEKESSIRRNSDMELFSGVHSPAYHHVEITSSIDYICDSEEQDFITVFKETFGSKEFDSEELALNYYPNREANLNIDFEKIQFTPGKKKPYSMDTTGASKEAEMRYLADAMLEGIGRIKRVTGRDVNMHDIPYIVEEDTENPPYNESEHH